MTDHDHTLDELASAHLDGLTTVDEARRIDADPELQARVAAMRAARDAIRAEVPPSSPEGREQAIAAALRAYDDTSAGSGGVTAIAAARASKRRVQPRRLVGIAAAVLLLAIAVPVVAELAGGGGDRDEMATSAGDSAEPDAAAGRGDTDDATASAGADAFEESADELSAPTPGAAGGLGRFATVDALEEAVRAALLDRAAYTDADPQEAGDGTAPCAERARAASGADGAVVQLTASAVLQDQAVEVLVLAQPDGARTMIVADPARGCEVIERRALRG